MSPPTPAVSAVIPFYGNPCDVEPLLESLSRQTVPLHEVIIADDASPIPFPRREGVQLVRAPCNRGFGSTVNMGAATATGDYLLILNSDLSISESFVEELLQHASPWQPAVVSPSLRERGRLVSVARRWPTVRTTFFSWLTPLARFRDRRLWAWLVGHYSPQSIASAGMEVDWVVGACMLIPAESFRAVRGFDERFHMNSEEVEMQNRLTRHGVHSVVVPAVEVGHVGGGSSDPSRRRQWLVTGTFIYFAKLRRASVLRLALMCASMLNLIWNMFRRLRGVPVHPLVGFADELELIRTGYAGREGTP